MGKQRSSSLNLYKILEEKILDLFSKKQELNEKLANEIFDLFYHDFYSYFYYKLRSKELAEDLAQESLLKIYKNSHQFDSSKAGFKTWAYQIARNQAIDFLRSRESKEKALTISLESFDQEDFFENDSVFTKILEHEKNEDIEKAVMSLNDHHRNILLSWLYDDLSMQELADLYSTNIQNIKNSLFQSKKKIKGFFYEK